MSTSWLVVLGGALSFASHTSRLFLVLAMAFITLKAHLLIDSMMKSTFNFAICWFGGGWGLVPTKLSATVLPSLGHCEPL